MRYVLFTNQINNPFIKWSWGRFSGGSRKEHQGVKSQFRPPFDQYFAQQALETFFIEISLKTRKTLFLLFTLQFVQTMSQSSVGTDFFEQGSTCVGENLQEGPRLMKD